MSDNQSYVFGFPDDPDLTEATKRALLESPATTMNTSQDDNSTDTTLYADTTLLPGQPLLAEDVQFVKDGNGNVYVLGDLESTVSRDA